MKDKNKYNLNKFSLVPNAFLYSFRSFWSLCVRHKQRKQLLKLGCPESGISYPDVVYQVTQNKFNKEGSYS